MKSLSHSISHLKAILRAGALGCTALAISLTGCGESSVAPAVPRKVSSKPVFGREINDSGVAEIKLDLEFLHEDHFACLSINVPNILGHDELKEVPWDSFEEQLASMVGQSNSSLSKMERIWVVLDRESIELMMGGDSASPLVFVIDYDSKPDVAELEAAQSELVRLGTSKEKKDDDESESDDDAPSFQLELIAKVIGDRRIIIGSAGLTKKLMGSGTSSELQRELSKLKFDKDIQGIITMGPIRPTLKTVLGMAAQFGGEQAQKFAALPDILQQIEIELALDGDDVLLASVLMDDPEMVKQFARIAQEAQADASAAGGGMPGGAMGGIPLGGFGGGGGGGGPRKMPESIFPLDSPEVMEQVGKQVQEDNLFSIEGVEDRLVFKLQRPEKFTELIVASIDDAKRGFDFGKRTQRLSSIGKALKSYHEEHKCFPPAGAVVESKTGLPDQLNWRVGLLPYLDQKDLYDKFDFNESWDSKLNLAAAKMMPEVFGDAEQVKDAKTCFHLPGGELGLFGDGKGKKSLDDIKDRKPWTAIVVECSDESAQLWTKPGVVEFEKTDLAKAGKPLENGVLFLNAAFDTRVVKNKDSENVQAVLSFDGDEKLKKSQFFELPQM